MRAPTIRIAVLIAVLGVVAAACGSDDGAGDATGATAGASGASGASGATAPQELGGTLVISNWDAYMPENLIPDFEAATGVTVELANHTTNEDIMGKITAQNGSGFDLVFVSGPFVQALVSQGWAAEVDHGQIPNLANLYPEANELGYDPGNTHSVPYTWGTTGICYRSDLVKDAPTSWELFRDPPADLKGRMTMLGTDRWLLQPALLSAGASINTTDPAEIDAATQWTLDAKANLLGFDDTTFYSKLVSGEASAVQAWDGWCEYGRAEDANIDFVIPDEGSDVWTDTMVILESSENKAAAHAFIDFVLMPEIGKAVTELVLYKVPNVPAMEAVDPAVIEQFPTLAITPQELLAQEPEEDLGPDGLQLWTEAVTQIKSG
ncbi:MAG TPA: spermidine/putrescine ABC transporter substrate-binding protein [Actinomycetota bacterium]|jgi:spermidine/putrescine transport system substrate-binding protein